MAAAALLMAVAIPVHGARRSTEAATPTLQEVGNAFEQNRLLAEADRLPALQQAQQSVAQVVRGGVDADRRAAARFLSGAIEYELKNYDRASQAFTEAVGDEKGPFADDAAFAAIEALEAAGRDADAAREWARWEKRFPTSPLIPAARL